jgi:crotonobetaine/carnitine-CoA ligase
MMTRSTRETFSARWAAAVERHGDRPFLLFRSDNGQVDTWTYAQFDGVVERTSDSLVANGVRPGDPIHVCLRNCPAFIALWLATARLGAWMVPVDPASSARDIANHISRTAPTVGFCARERSATYAEGTAGADLLTVVLDEEAADVAPGGTLAGSSERGPGASEPAPTDRLAVMFTSGTTSQPKGVVLTQGNYAHVARVMAEVIALTPDDRWLVTLPLFHANAQYYCFAPAIHVGASVALTASFSASRWVAMAHELEATHASLFAAPIRMILARTPEGTPPCRLRHVWFAQSLGVEHHLLFGELVGTLPRQLYGMTETVAIVTADRSDPPVHDLIGHPVGGRDIRLVEPATLRPVAPGEPGMMLVAGQRGGDLFAEYLDDPGTTERSFTADDDGRSWLLTGDLAQETETGALRFVGRADDVIKVAGENVSLTEVEAAVAQAPGVLEVAVLGKTDPIRDVVPVAYIVPRDIEDPPSIEQLTAWAEKNLSPQARPRDWHLIAALPRTSVGKVRRFQIGISPPTSQ